MNVVKRVLQKRASAGLGRQLAVGGAVGGAIGVPGYVWGRQLVGARDDLTDEMQRSHDLNASAPAAADPAAADPSMLQHGADWMRDNKGTAAAAGAGVVGAGALLAYLLRRRGRK